MCEQNDIFDGLWFNVV